MTRKEIVKALKKSEDELVKTKKQRRQEAHDGSSDERLDDLDAAIDDLKEQCKGYRAALKVKDGLRRSVSA